MFYTSQAFGVDYLYLDPYDEHSRSTADVHFHVVLKNWQAGDWSTSFNMSAVDAARKALR